MTPVRVANPLLTILVFSSVHSAALTRCASFSFSSCCSADVLTRAASSDPSAQGGVSQNSIIAELMMPPKIPVKNPMVVPCPSSFPHEALMSLYRGLSDLRNASPKPAPAQAPIRAPPSVDKNPGFVAWPEASSVSCNKQSLSSASFPRLRPLQASSDLTYARGCKRLASPPATRDASAALPAPMPIPASAPRWSPRKVPPIQAPRMTPTTELAQNAEAIRPTLCQPRLACVRKPSARTSAREPLWVALLRARSPCSPTSAAPKTRPRMPPESRHAALLTSWTCSEKLSSRSRPRSRAMSPPAAAVSRAEPW
mmetsp:Transcript_65715/g.186541  ORF Transcript_65715/g.186541 Transcript_65715/m.186541 type:complete len:312 (+) Transcript_65715:471-1406(+)